MKRRKTKNTILKAITTIAVIAFFIGAGSLDSVGTNIPVIMCAVSLAWLALFAYANRGDLSV